MFNSYVYNPTQKVNINAVSGTLTKTCEKSYFQCCHRKSDKFDSIINRQTVVVLQAMLMADDYVMFEVMTYRDFEELKEQSNDQRATDTSDL